MQNRAVRISECKMFNSDYHTNKNKTEHVSKWPNIPDNPYRILIIGGSWSGKTNAFLNLIDNQPDTDKKYLYAEVHMKQNINI